MPLKSLIAVWFILVASTAHATPITSGTVTLDGSELLVSTTRINRNGVASTWAAPKPFPGTLGCLGGGNCFYETVDVSTSPLEFVRVTYSLLSGSNPNIFLAAYVNSFNVASLSANYLGDPGSSLTLGGIPLAFEVIVPSGSSLVLAFSTVANNSFGTAFYTVDAFESAAAGAAIPEPATCGLLASGLALLGAARRRRSSARSAR